MAKRTVNVDPSIRGMARHLVADAIDDVEQRLVGGANVYVARAQTLEARADEWVKSYGRETADLAVRAVHMVPEREFLSAQSRRFMEDIQRRESLAACRTYGRDTWINRMSIRFTGLPFHL